jgi:hypothetical protein
VFVDGPTGLAEFKRIGCGARTAVIAGLDHSIKANIH